MPRVNVAATAVPFRLTDVGELGALLTIEMLPEAAPAAVGAKAALMVVCWPALTLSGSEEPLTLKGAPDAVICVMVRVAVPVLVMIRVCEVVVPTTSLVPKLTGFGLTW